ncbi:MAG: 16S rRNA (adenine(1518)-N(6)/adenine(1519)-N(6))-dimethyltransferase RsmA [Candidatus Pelagibacter sp.]
MIKAKKSLGQNFLIDQNIINKIINIINIKNKNVLEIGPGTGNLTLEILKKNPKKVILIEKDTKLANMLIKKFTDNVNVINQDVLKINENILCDQSLIVFGNLPYNISTEILSKWILNLDQNKSWFNYLILMFQKEVADRIISKFNTKDYGRLSILANWRLNIKKIFDVKATSFQPKPKVESTVLFFEPKKNYFKFKNPKNLEKITRIFFMHRRKMIKKPYKQLFNDNENIASKMGIDLNLRPQNLNLETYYELTEKYENLRS